MPRTTLVTLLLLVPLAGCKKDAAPPAGGGESAPAAKTVEPAKLGWIPVAKLGVELEMPADAKAEDGAGSSVMIMSDTATNCVVMLAKEDPEMADSYDKTVAYISEGKMGHGKLKAFSKKEKGANGGYKLEWVEESAITGKELHGVDYRVVLGGTQYGCGRKTESAAGAACVAHACASLRKK